MTTEITCPRRAAALARFLRAQECAIASNDGDALDLASHVYEEWMTALDEADVSAEVELMMADEDAREQSEREAAEDAFAEWQIGRFQDLRAEMSMTDNDEP